MKLSLMASLICLCTAGLLCETVRADDESDIRALIPAAAAMPKSDIEEFLTLNGLDTDKIENRSLTLVLGLGTTPGRDQESRTEFRHLVRTLSPLRLVQELGRLSGNRPNSVVTMIHEDRITEFTCETDGDAATGIVAFESPELFAGRVEYAALRENNRWRITEFHVPAYEIHIRATADGTGEEFEPEAEEVDL